MDAPKKVPIEVRRAAWDALWQILLSQRPSEDPEPSRLPLSTSNDHWKKGDAP
jgi:hypothetical protein